MKIFRKIGFIDFVIIIGLIIALFVGFCTFKHFRQTADKQIDSTSKINFQVFLRGVSFSGDEFPINIGDNAFITIRNVPYTELNIVDVAVQPRMIYLPNSDKILVKDPSQKDLYDVIVTITDTAKITKDGAVVGGNKIKMGLPIVLEGQRYKFSGIISDLKIANKV